MKRIARLALVSCCALFATHAITAQVADEKWPAEGHHPVPSIQDKETPAEKDARMKWFREARFGMFIHWGIYSVPAGRWQGKEVPGLGEWIMNSGSIPVADYKAFAPQFNPTQFDAHAIVALAKAAGMKYIVITAKHHDGFAMYDSKADPFNIMSGTPFKRDPLHELAVEAHKQGIKFGFYYSQYQDWTAPGGAAYKTGDHKPPTYHWDPAQDGDFSHYLHTKAIPQMKELLTNYGESPDIIWFDTPYESGYQSNDHPNPKDVHGMTPQWASEIVSLLNTRPKLIWNNRLGGGYNGDTETPEQYIPANGYPGRDWESCMTINDTWGYKVDDKNFKSTETLLRNLIDIASKGGNYLLNIGPESTGVVPPEEVARLEQMGKWMDVNGESIYATKPTLFGSEAGAFSTTEKDKQGKPKFVPEWKWRSTTKADKVYIHLFEWPSTHTFHVAKMPRTVTGAYLLADTSHKPLKFTQKGGALDVQLPDAALDPIATVLVLKTR
ncbi:MAG: alpha-L-fucosidase [Edaphobacter sp.]|uniref:alpha-L-fucosidase n=1 Tax=Edaphobacter sp. TaxID=1934404 RepID=UPI0023941C2E|nr:alpha-L-fucosidase [Edaphobacter sp.]MDE1176823.1 alpha-L-fucosidase [Edaphobacter sp.]